MVKYKVAIPPPSAKRMAKNKKIILETVTGMMGLLRQDTTVLDENVSEFEFSMPEEYEYKYNSSTLDGATFEVIVEYSNDTGTRTQRISLVPENVS